MTHVDFAPARDPLLRDAPLDHALDLPVLGVATRFETNSRFALGIAEEAFGAWRGVDADADPLGTLRVRVVVREGDEGGAAHAAVAHLCPDDTRLLVHTPGSVAVSDPLRRESVAYVTTALVADRAHFRAAVLEAITLALLSHFDRHPVHAAAVARDGHALLLAGPSGAGKSTLAYVAHESGDLHVLGDDRVWVQLEPTLRVWGWPAARARLLPDAVARFPEVAERGVRSTVDGKEKLVVPVSAADAATRAPWAGRATVCVLARATAGEPASLAPLSSAEVARALAARPDAGFDRFPERHAAVATALAAGARGGGGWRLALSDDPREAVPLLRRALDDTDR